MSDDVDRQLILRRRLAFVASALSGLAIGPAAEAQPAEGEACDGAPPTAEDVARADALFASTLEAQKAGRPSEAANAAVAAYNLVPTSQHAVTAGTALLESDDPFAAFLLLAEHIRCRGDADALAPVVAKLEAATGGISLAVVGEPGWELTIDGRPVPRPLQSLVIRLGPGKHVVSIVSPRYSPPAVTVDVAIDRIEKVRMAAVEPMPCLSMMRPTHRESFVEIVGGAVVPMVAVDTRVPVDVGGGAGARGAVAIQFTEGGWFHADLSAVATAPPTTGYGIGSVDLRYHFVPEVGFGAGFSGGFAVSPRGVTPLWGPTVVPLAIAYKAVRFELRVPCWFDDQPDRGALYIAPHAFIGFGFPVLERVVQDD